MSAFLCSASHISAIVNAVGPRDLPGSLTMEEAFTKLANQNAASVDCLYEEVDSTITVSGYRHDYGVTVSPIDALKAAHSLRYQSCETPEYGTSEAGILLNHIEHAICRRLPGYEESSAWSIEQRAPTGVVSLYSLATMAPTLSARGRSQAAKKAAETRKANGAKKRNG